MPNYHIPPDAVAKARRMLDLGLYPSMVRDHHRPVLGPNHRWEMIQLYRWALGLHPFGYWCTLTFKDPPGFEYAVKKWNQFLDVGGWRNSFWVRTDEYQDRKAYKNKEALHFHAMMSDSIWKEPHKHSQIWWRSNVAPMCRVEVVSSRAYVGQYITKYITPDIENHQGANIWLSNSFKNFFGLIYKRTLGEKGKTKRLDFHG